MQTIIDVSGIVLQSVMAMGTLWNKYWMTTKFFNFICTRVWSLASLWPNLGINIHSIQYVYNNNLGLKRNNHNLLDLFPHFVLSLTVLSENRVTTMHIVCEDVIFSPVRKIFYILLKFILSKIKITPSFLGSLMDKKYWKLS